MRNMERTRDLEKMKLDFAAENFYSRRGLYSILETRL